MDVFSPLTVNVAGVTWRRRFLLFPGGAAISGPTWLPQWNDCESAGMAASKIHSRE